MPNRPFAPVWWAQGAIKTKAPCLLFRSGAFLWDSGEMDLSAWTADELLGRESLGKLLQTVTKLQHHPDLLQPRTRS